LFSRKGGGLSEVFSWSGSNNVGAKREQGKKNSVYLSSTATRWPAAASWLAVVRPPIPEPMMIASYSVSGEALADCREEDGTAATAAIERAARRGFFAVALARERDDAVAPFELARHA
jgi:hypothetical protein